MHRWPGPLVAFTALLAVACSGTGDDDDVEPPPPPPATDTFTVGAGPDDGTAGFRAVEDGVEMTLHPGAQGGFHVYVSFRFDEDQAMHLTAIGGRPLIRRDARRVSTGQLVSRSKHTAPLIPSLDAPGKYDTQNTIPVFLCPSPVGIPVADERLILEVEAGQSEEDPAPLKGTLEFIPRCPEGDQAEFCRRICFG